MSALLIEIVTLLTAGFREFAMGIGGGIGDFIQYLFVSGAGTTEDPYKLSIFGGVVIIFSAVSLTIGLSRWVLNFLTSLGARNS